MRHISIRTKARPVATAAVIDPGDIVGDAVLDPCAGMTGYDLFKCRKQYPEA